MAKKKRKRLMPLHLQTQREFHSTMQKRHKGELAVVEDKLLTPMMKQYCEELVFGGVYRTVAQWARYCGVGYPTIRLWNSMEAVDTYMRELRETRRRMIMENFETTVGTAMSELVKIMKIDFKVQTPSGLEVKPSLVAEKQRAIQTMLEFMRGGGGKDAVNIFVNQEGQDDGDPDPQENPDLHGMTKAEIDQELKDLKAIGGSSDDDTSGNKPET